MTFFNRALGYEYNDSKCFQKADLKNLFYEFYRIF
jgi:hypothetical protein